MLNRLRPRTLAGWVGWAVFLFVFGWAVGTSRESPLGFRLIDLPVYFVLALLTAGFCFVLVKITLARGDRPASKAVVPASFEREVGESITRIVARAEANGVEARRVREEPWYADAVVDLDEVASRWFVEGHGLADSTLTVPNPYFVLSLDALLKWGFASAVEVREATRWATSPTPPVRWQNPLFRERLNFMGWSDPEAYARVGLFHWGTDPETPDPRAAAVEAKIRAAGQVYDVPRPASL